MELLEARGNVLQDLTGPAGGHQGVQAKNAQVGEGLQESTALIPGYEVDHKAVYQRTNALVKAVAEGVLQEASLSGQIIRDA